MKYVLITAAVLLAVLIIGIRAIPKNNEPLTELYFDDHLDLPKTAEINKEYNFSFAIHNLEYQEMGYKYEITIEYNNRKFILDKNIIYLNNEETKHIQGKFTIPDKFDRAKITVNLINKNQAIHFWVDKTS
jgi:hypothetical protein